VSCARHIVGDEPFAMILPDALIIAPIPCVRQLTDCYQSFPGCYVATREVRVEEFSRFGVLDLSTMNGSPWEGRLFRVAGMIEKPTRETAPSRFGIFGRYLFEPEIFGYINRTAPDRNGEIQITDALALYCRDHPTYALCFEGAHYDIGDKLGFVQASVEVALRDPDMASDLRRFLTSIGEA
jgi:UTP--glucose-1-phosphate uridylyltransferase